MQVRMNQSKKMYVELSKLAQNLGINVPAAHRSLFKVSENTEQYNNSLYYQQIGKKIPKKRPGDQNCKYCESFHLQNLKTIDKNQDVLLGNSLENCIQSFINKHLLNAKYKCDRADIENLHMPDFSITCPDKKIYFEFKVIFRPFIKISQYVDSIYECYSNSLTLDVSNGKKLANQRELVEDELGIDNVAYVYWYDLPCVKGIYWMKARDVYKLMDSQAVYNRRRVAGDYQYGIKRGATNKIYLPLLRMHDFEKFFGWINS
jgi:hypothetical protein